MLDVVKDKLKSMGEGIKAFFIAIGGIVVAIATFSIYIFVKKRQNEIIDEKINNLKDEANKAQGVIDFNNKNIKKIEEEESLIEEKIEQISKEENKESLDDFFNKRGF